MISEAKNIQQDDERNTTTDTAADNSDRKPPAKSKRPDDTFLPASVHTQRDPLVSKEKLNKISAESKNNDKARASLDKTKKKPPQEDEENNGNEEFPQNEETETEDDEKPKNLQHVARLKGVPSDKINRRIAVFSEEETTDSSDESYQKEKETIKQGQKSGRL